MRSPLAIGYLLGGIIATVMISAFNVGWVPALAGICVGALIMNRGAE